MLLKICEPNARTVKPNTVPGVPNKISAKFANAGAISKNNVRKAPSIPYSDAYDPSFLLALNPLIQSRVIMPMYRLMAGTTNTWSPYTVFINDAKKAPSDPDAADKMYSFFKSSTPFEKQA